MVGHWADRGRAGWCRRGIVLAQGDSIYFLLKFVSILTPRLQNATASAHSRKSATATPRRLCMAKNSPRRLWWVQTGKDETQDTRGKGGRAAGAALRQAPGEGGTSAPPPTSGTPETMTPATRTTTATKAMRRPTAADSDGGRELSATGNDHQADRRREGGGRWAGRVC
jgi:hypothetical protein